ncbi:uncharacterized protein LOC142886694 [Nelusetta ayraudi]|uniref:uncharacterized protein LOC142886694 n=1 Tax=Nelusetta ayraudi TaxID=303726 RepID=UPI003F6F5F26
MVLCEEGECSVCLQAYTRSERIPRLLHCRHTFCQPCLETMSQAQGSLVTVGCPLCRRLTCIGRGLGLQEALWVDSRLWEQIPEEEEEEEEEVEQEDEVRLKGEDEKKETESQREAECVSGHSRRTRLRLPAFLKRFSLTKQQQQRQEMVVPGSSSSSVEMKSWRRLSTDEMF